MAQTVIGIFEDKENALQAMHQLLSAGFPDQNIDFSVSHATPGPDPCNSSHIPENVNRFFCHLFSNKKEVANYATVARRTVILTVHTQTAADAERAVAIMDAHDSVDVEQLADQYREESAFKAPSGFIPVIEEEIEIEEEQGETGTVRVRSRIIGRLVETSFRLREEHTRVESQPVNCPAPEAELASLKAGVVEMATSATVPAGDKEGRVPEEVLKSKEVKEHPEADRSPARRTEVEAEPATLEKQSTQDRSN